MVVCLVTKELVLLIFESLGIAVCFLIDEPDAFVKVVISDLTLDRFWVSLTLYCSADANPS